jgi:16S rRNA (guanine527-N7)-methyltransferase
MPAQRDCLTLLTIGGVGVSVHPRVSVVTEQEVPQFVPDALTALELHLPEGALAKLAHYLDLLLEANKTTNLTAIRERDAAWSRLIIDSLTVLPGLEPLPADSHIIDIGTGGGLPGIPLAIARPDLRITLLDSTAKKVSLLDQFISTLKLANVTAIQNRAEALGHDKRHRQQYDVAVSRAVGHMSAVLEYSLPLVKVGGRVLAMKGPRLEQELAEAADALDVLGAGDLQIVDAYPESFDNDLVIASIVKERPTPDKYPRNASQMRQHPL